MIIHQLQIINFKSYNREHTLGPFDKHFNCIIGPNGNGKSNIIDAVLFVFGFKSSKLRQDNLSSLIHRSAFAQPDKASVKVTFKENGETFSVSRTVTKGGNTYYKMNDQKVNWNELRENLISKKIDLNKNLFIILQGEVERLCELSPLTMVDYLEYVSGSDQLKQPIQNTQKDYIETAICREQKRMALNVKEKFYENIKEKAVDLVTKVLLDLRVKILYHLVMKKTVFQNMKNLEHLNEQLLMKQQIVKRIQSQAQKIQVQISQKVLKIKQLQKQTGRVQKEIQTIENECQKITIQVNGLKRSITFLTGDRDKKCQELKRYQSEQKELNELAQKQKDFMQRIKAIIQQINSQKQLPQLQICQDLQTKLLVLREQQDALTNKNNQKLIILKEGRQKLAILQNKQQQFTQSKEGFRLKLKQIKISLTDITEKLRQNHQTVEHLQRQVKNKPDQKMQVLSQKQKIIQEIRSANRLKILCPQIALYTLRDVVVIDSAYAQVIQTVLPHLDYFVVDNVKQGREISEYLKKKQVGRMTLLIKQIINQSVKDIQIIPKSPNQTKLVLQLITCRNQDAKNILIWALGNTLLTNSLDVAMKVAYYDQKRYRVITTNGQFIDSSGTMTKLTLKTAQLKENSDMLAKKLQNLQRLEANLSKKKQELCSQQEDILHNITKIQEQQRQFDGLDPMLLDQLEKEVQKSNLIIRQNRQQTEMLMCNLNQIKQKLKYSKFQMVDYNRYIQMIRELVRNQESIKKIENISNILKNLLNKKQSIQSEIQKCAKKIQSEVRVKVSVETSKQKLANEIQTKKMIIESIVQTIDQFQNQKRELEEQKQKELNKLNEKHNNSRPLREQVYKIRSAIKNVEYNQLQLKNKIAESLNTVKQFSELAYKQIYLKYPELILNSKFQSRTQMRDLSMARMFRQILMIIVAKREIHFIETLSRSEKDFFFNRSYQVFAVYNYQDDFLPQQSDMDLLVQSIQINQFRFSHSFQQEKLKHLQKNKNFRSQNNYDVQLLNDYKLHKQQFESLRIAVNEIESHLNSTKKELIGLRNKRLQIFMTSFNEINVQLNNIYTKLTGGRAELNFVDSMSPFEGVQFAVRPVNKSWKSVNLLSGGEKTFTSLALIFACEQIKKFPFYFMDQIDAALDYKNTTLLAQYIKQKKGTQHIVISLRKNMYQQCRRIVGIYKVKDQSRTIETSMDDLLSRNSQ